MSKQVKLTGILAKRSLWILIFSGLFLAIGLTTVSAGVGPYTGRIALGQDHTCILQYDQSVDCYGWNSRGQAEDHPGPLHDIVSGTFHNCGLLPDDTAVCWGDGRNGELNVPGGAFKQIAAGDGYTCGLRPTGMVECWGKNHVGQAIPVTGPFDRIELGSHHGCGFLADGSMDCWGYDRDGRNVDVPAGNYLDQSVGTAHNCVLLADGSADCWGYNLWGQAEDRPGPFVQIEPGWGHTCALDANGDVECWGNQSGNVPTSITGPFVQIFAGGNHYCGIRANETLECWGYNSYGQGDTNEMPFGEQPDADGDGVLDVDDHCAGTVLPEDVPPTPKKNRFYANSEGNFVDGEGNLAGISVTDTGGCSGIQIIEAMGLGQGHTDQGITRGALEEWIAGL